jgi:hypothetical protein
LGLLLDDVFNAAVSRYSTGEKARGRDIIAALRTLKEIEGREPTESERAILRRFPGFGCVVARLLLNHLQQPPGAQGLRRLSRGAPDSLAGRLSLQNKKGRAGAEASKTALSHFQELRLVCDLISSSL